MLCSDKLSLRTSTYFWAFMHMFLAVVFLLACSLESFQFNRNEDEQSFWIYVSAPIAGRRADIFILWCYGILYFSSGMMMFHGVHKELTTLIKCVLFVYIILEVCAIGFIKRLINSKLEESSQTRDFMDLYFIVIQSSLIIFFLTVQVLISIFYSINLFIYVYILQKSKAIIQHCDSHV
ncbi:uncharacterized protein LOC110847585 [Folsomia candida]|uniref:uncharacterized protein LOC110847585 n=1 Tax=Folsomia candida TaxID=158441 RepID=UPI000B909932|nr:uncharacterized protein LOC110847585 [Folsomia candida]